MKTIYHPKIFLFCIALAFLFPVQAYSKNFREHFKDIQDIIPIDFSLPGGQAFVKTISKTVIDENKEFRRQVLRRNPKLAAYCNKTGNTFYARFSHRVLFHWGAGGKIPFRHSPLKDYFDKLEAKKIPPHEIKQYKKMIVEEWQRRRKLMFDATEQFLKSSGVDQRKAAALAKPLATLIYDIHILGDWETELTKGLQPIKYLKGDIIELLEKTPMFKRNPKMQLIVKELKSLGVTDSKKTAVQIAKVLKNKLPEALESSLGKTLGTVLVKSAVVTGYIAKLVNRQKKLTNRIKNPNVRTAIKTGAFVFATSTIFNCYRVITDQIDIKQAFTNTLEDTTLSSSSIVITDGIIQKIGGGKYAISAVLNKSASTALKAVSSGLNFGVATFIFDESQSVYNIIKGDIDFDTFVEESGENIVKGIATGSACYCAVLLGVSTTNPFGLVVIGISMGTYILTTKAISVFKEFQQEDYLFVEDIYYLLPLRVQRRKTVWDVKQRDTVWNAHKLAGGTIWNMGGAERKTVWDHNHERKTVWDE